MPYRDRVYVILTNRRHSDLTIFLHRDRYGTPFNSCPITGSTAAGW
jgi:hypothetical protein